MLHHDSIYARVNGDDARNGGHAGDVWRLQPTAGRAVRLRDKMIGPCHWVGVWDGLAAGWLSPVPPPTRAGAEQRETDARLIAEGRRVYAEWERAGGSVPPVSER